MSKLTRTMRRLAAGDALREVKSALSRFETLEVVLQDDEDASAEQRETVSAAVKAAKAAQEAAEAFFLSLNLEG